MIELNKVLLVARLTKDPELKYLPNGTPVCELRVASDRVTDRSGPEFKKETLFINVTCWSKQAEFANQWFKKGGGILIEGRLRMETWTDREGNPKDRISITAEKVAFAETKAEAQARQSARGGDRDFEDEGPYGGESRGPAPARRAAAPASEQAREAERAPRDQDSGGGSQTEDDLPF